MDIDPLFTQAGMQECALHTDLQTTVKSDRMVSNFQPLTSNLYTDRRIFMINRQRLVDEFISLVKIDSLSKQERKMADAL